MTDTRNTLCSALHLSLQKLWLQKRSAGGSQDCANKSASQRQEPSECHHVVCG